jgi:hypothetical protein
LRTGIKHRALKTYRHVNPCFGLALPARPIRAIEMPSPNP